MISELESPQLFEIEERVGAAAKQLAADVEVEALNVNAGRVISAVLATYFDLVNLEEKSEIIHLRYYDSARRKG